MSSSVNRKAVDYLLSYIRTVTPKFGLSVLEPLTNLSAETMKKNADDMQSRYDFSQAKRIQSPYATKRSSTENHVTIHHGDGTSETRVIQKTSVMKVTLEPDLADAFPNQEAVTAALRQFLEISKIMQVTTPKKRSKRAAPL
jgi:hypothetical protein